MSHFPFNSQGYVKLVKGYWLLLTCDPEIMKYYTWLARSWGIELEMGSRHGAHISVVKGTKPKNLNLWNNLRGRKFNFDYSNQLRHNGYHAWLDIKAPELSEIRERLGLSAKPFHSFHLTVGRLKLGIDHELHEPRPKNLRKKLRKHKQIEIVRRK